MAEKSKPVTKEAKTLPLHKTIATGKSPKSQKTSVKGFK
jgi:hypothetical protein